MKSTTISEAARKAKIKGKGFKVVIQKLKQKN